MATEERAVKALAGADEGGLGIAVLDIDAGFDGVEKDAPALDEWVRREWGSS